MNLIVSCTEAQQEELTVNGLLPEAKVTYLRDGRELGAHTANA